MSKFEIVRRVPVLEALRTLGIGVQELDGAEIELTDPLFIVDDKGVDDFYVQQHESVVSDMRLRLIQSGEYNN